MLVMEIACLGDKNYFSGKDVTGDAERIVLGRVDLYRIKCGNFFAERIAVHFIPQNAGT